MLLKALAKSNDIFSLSLLRAITLERKPSKKKQRTNTKKAAKRIKRDNFTRAIKKSKILLSQY